MEPLEGDIEAIARSYARMFGDDPKMYERALSALRASRRKQISPREYGKMVAERERNAMERQREEMAGYKEALMGRGYGY